MRLDELLKVLRAPIHPVETRGPREWVEIEAKLGTGLPEDYKVFMDLFGTGTINEFLVIFNPFSSNRFVNLIDRAFLDFEGLAESRTRWPELFVYDRFPSPAGLLPAGTTHNGEMIYWKTLGHPNEWPLVIFEGRGPKCASYSLRLTEFLGRLLDHSLQCEVLPPDFPTWPVVFAPITLGSSGSSP